MFLQKIFMHAGVNNIWSKAKTIIERSCYMFIFFFECTKLIESVFTFDVGFSFV